MAARLALWEPQDDDGGHRRSVYMGAPRPLWSPFIFNPPIVPPSRGDSGGTKVVPPNPPRDGLSSTEMESRALRSLGSFVRFLAGDFSTCLRSHVNSPRPPHPLQWLELDGDGVACFALVEVPYLIS